MKTDDLIEALAQDLKPVRRHALALRLAIGLGLGATGTLLLVGAGLGFRPDLWLAMHGAAFWIKWIYTASLGLCATVATARLARPNTGSLGWLWVLIVPVAGLVVLSIAEMTRTPQAEWLAMWLGASWKVCPLNVFLLSVPLFAGLLWSFRQLAPTRLRAAGATAGLTAGAWGATLYCFHCPEVSALFVLTWYSLGIGLAALAGALIGPRLLRW